MTALGFLLGAAFGTFVTLRVVLSHWGRARLCRNRISIPEGWTAELTSPWYELKRKQWPGTEQNKGKSA